MAEPETAPASIVTWLVPPAALMLKLPPLEPLFVTQLVATKHANSKIVALDERRSDGTRVLL